MVVSFNLRGALLGSSVLVMDPVPGVTAPGGVSMWLIIRTGPSHRGGTVARGRVVVVPVCFMEGRLTLPAFFVAFSVNCAS